MTKDQQKARSMKVFGIIWSGQLVSTIGSGLTGFALGVWIYVQTGSIVLFALNILAFTLPGVLLSPLAGVIVDRWDRRRVMILSDSGAGLSTLFVALMLASGQLEVWHVYLATAFSSAFSSLQWPAYSAATTMLVPKEQLGRAAGMVQIGQAISQLLSPALAGALFVVTGLWSIILIDFATFAFAVLTLLFVRIPSPKSSTEDKAGKLPLREELTYGWRYIRARSGLMGLLIYFAGINFFLGMIGPLITPMMLDLTTPDEMGRAISIAGVGMLIGTLVMSAWGGPKRRVIGVVGFGALSGLAFSLVGLRPSIPLITVAGFGFFFVLPILNGSSQALWQSKVPPDVQGRVFAVRRMIAQSMSPLAIIIAAPLAENVFDPLMAEGGPLASSIGQIIGVGPGRGTGLLFILLGMLVVVISALAYAHPRIRLVEDELPDIIIEAKDEDAETSDEAEQPTTAPATSVEATAK